MARSITTRRPLWVERGRRSRDGAVGYATDGTPVDCVRLASLGLVEDFTPTWSSPGINHGANLGDDITYSGTVAAALEGVVLGHPGDRRLAAVGRAASSTIARRRLRLRARRRLRRAPGRALERRAAAAERRCSTSTSPAGPPERRRGHAPRQARLPRRAALEREEERPPALLDLRHRLPASTTSAGTDLAAVARGRIALTPLHFDLTDRPGLEALRALDLEQLLAASPTRRERAPAPIRAGAARARELRAQLAYHSRRYYVDRRPRDRRRRLRRALQRAASRSRTSTPSSSAPTRRPSASAASRSAAWRRSRHLAADALARQRALGGGAARLGRADAQPPRARGHRGPELPLRLRAEDRRARGQPALPRRRARARRDARQRRDRRGRHAQPAHDRRDPAADRGRAAAARGARRGLHVAAGLPGAQRALRRAAASRPS